MILAKVFLYQLLDNILDQKELIRYLKLMKIVEVKKEEIVKLYIHLQINFLSNKQILTKDKKFKVIAKVNLDPLILLLIQLQIVAILQVILIIQIIMHL